MDRLNKLVNFDNTDGAGSPPPEQDASPQTGGQDNKWTPEQQAEFDKRASALRKSAEAEGRKKAQTEFEAGKKTEQDAAEKKRLEEQGNFQAASQLAEKAKTDAEERARKAEQKAETLELQFLFEKAARSLKVEFINEQAAADAFSKLDMSLIGEDKSGMSKAIEKLQKDYSYYFGNSEAKPNTDAGQRGRRETKQMDEKERESQIKQRYNIRKPR